MKDHAGTIEAGSGTMAFLKGVKSSLTCIDRDPFLIVLLPKKGLAGATGSTGGFRGVEDAPGVKLVAFGLGLKTKAGALAVNLLPDDFGGAATPLLVVAGFKVPAAGASVVFCALLGLKGGISKFILDFVHALLEPEAEAPDVAAVDVFEDSTAVVEGALFWSEPSAFAFAFAASFAGSWPAMAAMSGGVAKGDLKF